MNKSITIGEMIPYLSLASTIIKFANRDLRKGGQNAKDAYYSLNFKLGKYLQDSVEEFVKIINKDNADIKGGIR